MSRHKSHRKGKGKKVYSIIVDGETEIWYFQLMKKHEDIPRIDIKPELPKKKKLKEQYELVLENYRKGYDKVIWLLDFDTIPKEDKESKKGQPSKLQEFKTYYERLNDYENVEVLVNTPCLEFWYLLHFEFTSKYFSKCENATKSLKKSHLKDYEKTQKYYKKSSNDLYKKLKPHQAEAIVNANKLGSFDFENPTSAKAEIYHVFSTLDI